MKIHWQPLIKSGYQFFIGDILHKKLVFVINCAVVILFPIDKRISTCYGYNFIKHK